VKVAQWVAKRSFKIGNFINKKHPDKMSGCFFVCYYALWRLIASLISSSDALHGNNGSNHTFAVPECILPRFGQYNPASVPTG